MTTTAEAWPSLALAAWSAPRCWPARDRPNVVSNFGTAGATRRDARLSGKIAPPLPRPGPDLSTHRGPEGLGQPSMPMFQRRSPTNPHEAKLATIRRNITDADQGMRYGIWPCGPGGVAAASDRPIWTRRAAAAAIIAIFSCRALPSRDGALARTCRRGGIRPPRSRRSTAAPECFSPIVLRTALPSNPSERTVARRPRSSISRLRRPIDAFTLHRDRDRAPEDLRCGSATPALRCRSTFIPLLRTFQRQRAASHSSRSSAAARLQPFNPGGGLVSEPFLCPTQGRREREWNRERRNGAGFVGAVGAIGRRRACWLAIAAECHASCCAGSRRTTALPICF